MPPKKKVVERKEENISLGPQIREGMNLSASRLLIAQANSFLALLASLHLSMIPSCMLLI
jgi:hypothetical protein